MVTIYLSYFTECLGRMLDYKSNEFTENIYYLLFLIKVDSSCDSVLLSNFLKWKGQRLFNKILSQLTKKLITFWHETPKIFFIVLTNMNPFVRLWFQLLTNISVKNFTANEAINYCQNHLNCSGIEDVRNFKIQEQHFLHNLQ